MVNQHTEDMRSRLAEARRMLAVSMADEQRLYQRFSEARREADRWRARAHLAVSRGMDDLARPALERSGEHEAHSSEFHLQYLEQKGRVEEMKRRLLDSELAASSPSSPLVADLARTERTLARLRRQEDQAGERRARLAAMAELERDEVAERLAVLEREDRLERQLAELKSRLGTG